MIAVFLWFTVTSKEYRYGDFNIPLELHGLPQNLIVTGTTFDNQEVNNVTVRVRASETLIRSLGDRSMFLRVDITGMGVGQHPVQLSDDMVMGRPPGAEITDIFPRVINIEIEQLLIRPFVAINPEILGKPADNYDITNIRSEPPSVRISGPESVVEGIDNISTQQVNVDGMREVILERSVRLILPHPQVSLSPENVTLRIEINEKSISRNFENLTVEVRGGEFQTNINPQRLDVWVQGPISQVNRLSAENLTVFIRLDGDEPRGENIRLDPQLEVVPADSFSAVTLERFSQSYVDALITSRRRQ
jgi:YbbR domain-containing protein